MRKTFSSINIIKIRTQSAFFTMTKQSVLLRSTGATATYRQNIIFRIQPKKMIVKLATLNSSSAGYTICTCPQLTPYPLFFSYPSGSGEPNSIWLEFDVQNLSSGDYTFYFTKTDGTASNVTELLVQIEFSD